MIDQTHLDGLNFSAQQCMPKRLFQPEDLPIELRTIPLHLPARKKRQLFRLQKDSSRTLRIVRAQLPGSFTRHATTR